MALLEVFSATGNNLYAHIRNVAGQVWNGSAFVAYNVANWATYVIPLTEDTSSGFYHAVVPGLSAQRLTVLIYGQLTGSPAAGDDPYGSSTGLWDGTTWESGWSTTSRTVTGVGSGVDVISINGVSAAAVKLSISAQTIVTGTAITGTLTVAQMTTNLSSAVNKLYVGRVVYWTSGVLLGQVAAIADYDGATKKITFAQPITAAPANGDTFVIV